MWNTCLNWMRKGSRSRGANPRRLALFCLLGVVVGAALPARQVFAFSEEPFSSHLPPGVGHSTLHYELTRAMAVCAGYGTHNAESVARYATLADLGKVAGWAEDLCQGSLPLSPSTADQVVDQGFDPIPLADPLSCSRDQARVFPIVEGGTETACATSRFGGFVSVFHFPSFKELEMLHTWAMSRSGSLSGRRIAAYGGRKSNPLSWKCLAKWPAETIQIGANIRAGSLAALGIYLHALADHGSHNDCITHVADSSEALKEPLHHGRWRRDPCSFMSHRDELTTNATRLGERPLWRSYAALVGNAAATWKNGNVDPNENHYASLTGIYRELLDYRDANPAGLTFPYRPIPANLDDVDYRKMLDRIYRLLNENTRVGGAAGRARAAADLESWCDAAVPKR